MFMSTIMALGKDSLSWVKSGNANQSTWQDLSIPGSFQCPRFQAVIDYTTKGQSMQVQIIEG